MILLLRPDTNSSVSISKNKISKEDDNSTIAITSASPSVKNKDFNGFVGSEKRNPSSENDLFAFERNSEQKKK